MWLAGRNQRALFSDSPLRPLSLGGPARIRPPHVCYFSSTCELPAFPLKSKPLPPPPPPLLLSSRGQISLNCLICPGISYSHRALTGTYVIKFGCFLLLICIMSTSILGQPEELWGKGKGIFLSPITLSEEVWERIHPHWDWYSLEMSDLIFCRSEGWEMPRHLKICIFSILVLQAYTYIHF